MFAPSYSSASTVQLGSGEDTLPIFLASWGI